MWRLLRWMPTYTCYLSIGDATHTADQEERKKERKVGEGGVFGQDTDFPACAVCFSKRISPRKGSVLSIFEKNFFGICQISLPRSTYMHVQVLHRGTGPPSLCKYNCCWPFTCCNTQRPRWASEALNVHGSVLLMCNETYM